MMGAAGLTSQARHSKVRLLLLVAAAAALLGARAEAAGAAAGAACAGEVRPGCLRAKRHLLCSGGFDRKYTSGSHKVRALTLCAWPGPGFDPGAELRRFQLLERFTLALSNVSALRSDFPDLPHLQTVELSGLRLEALSASALARLPSLRTLDLRASGLRTLPAAALAAPPNLRSARLADNPWDCSGRGMDWLLRRDRPPEGSSELEASLEEDDEAEAEAEAAARVEDADALVCRDDAFNRRPLLTVLRYRQAMEAGCPREANCSCSLTVVPDVRGARGPLGALLFIPVVTVDCAARGLSQLPPALPANATILHVEHNQITDLRPLVGNAHYGSVQDVYLDGNAVASVAALEGSSWLLHFRLLSLRANRLTRLPTYALESALQRNPQAARLYLGRNPWRCDCQTTPSFQEFLAKYRQVVQDQQDIRCAAEGGGGGGGAPAGAEGGGGGEAARVLVRDVSRSALCREHAAYAVQPLDLLNGALASLILLILGKLAYDYWHFKRTGKLPWIVTKMP